MRRLTKYAAGTAVAAAVVAASGAAAWAAWQANGAGNASAKAGQSVTLTTVATTAPGDLLYPGGTGDVKLKVRNDNPFRVHLSAVVGAGPITPDAAHAAGCTTTGVTLHTPVLGAWSLPANQTTELTLDNAVDMSNASDNGCQGATFTIPVILVGISNP